MTANELTLVDDYLGGKLSEEERLAFERQLAGNERLRREFEQHKLLRRTIQRYGEAKRTVAELHAALTAEGFFDQFDPPVPRRRRRYGWWLFGLFMVLFFTFVLTAITRNPFYFSYESGVPLPVEADSLGQHAPVDTAWQQLRAPRGD